VKLVAGDVDFYQARGRDFIKHQPVGVRNYILTDVNGHQVLNTFVPFGANLPRQGTPTQLAQVFSQQKTVLTDLFVGPVTGYNPSTFYY
jgi:hypothetical protein